MFPEGTISLDLEPMRGKSGTARLAQQAGVPVVPVGLWGSHRILMKGRKPHWQWGVAQVAVVGQPVDDRPRRTRQGQRPIGSWTRSPTCVARAREIYPQHPAPGEDDWWWRDPETARRRTGGRA